MKNSFCIDLQRFMRIPTKFPLSLLQPYRRVPRNPSFGASCQCRIFVPHAISHSCGAIASGSSMLYAVGWLFGLSF